MLLINYDSILIIAHIGGWYR